MNYKSEDQSIMMQYLTQYVDKTSRIAIVGVGNEDRNDDFVGPFVLRGLQEGGLAKANLVLIDAGTGPSNYIVDLVEWNPQHIIMVDAVDAQETPGTLLLVAKDQLHSRSVDSHSNAKILLLDFLIANNPQLKISILGIQVKDISLERKMSVEVEAAAAWLIKALFEVLQ